MLAVAPTLRLPCFPRALPDSKPAATPDDRRGAPAAFPLATRRRALTTMAGLGALGAAGWLAHSQTHVWRPWLATYRTGVGEQLPVTFDDATLLVLNTASAVDVRDTPAGRDIILHAGEILVETPPPAPSSQLTIRTDHGLGLTNGARVVVRRFGHATRFDVLQGHVVIQPDRAVSAWLDLSAGQRGKLHADGSSTPLPGNPEVAAWRRGRLVARHMRLDRFLNDMARYTTWRVAYAPEVAGLTLSGDFALDDVYRVLASLPRILPVTVTRHYAPWRGDTVRVAAR